MTEDEPQAEDEAETEDEPQVRRPRRQLVLLALVAVVSAFLGAAVATVLQDDSEPPREVVAPPGANPTLPTDIVVEPDEGLVDGDTVEVRVTGFDPATSIAVAVCLESTIASGDIARCDLANASTVTADDEGSITTTVAVHNPLRLAEGDVACDAEERCVIGAAPVGEYERAIGAPISFAEAVEVDPADAAAVTATRTADDAALVDVNGVRFDPGEDLRVALCLTGEGSDQPDLRLCDYELSKEVTAGADGTFQAQIEVRAVQAGGSADDPLVDCREAHERCRISVDRTTTRRGLVHTPIEE
ncbi:MAG TPA: neocarzinostatin apoprotein domain-containing protein [Iamia sp.]